MRPRTIAKHELVGMGATTSQLPTRDWKPLRSPRNQKMQPPSDIASRSPRPRHVAKPDTTATLLMVTGNAMVKLYRLVADLQRLNAERPALQGGSVILPGGPRQELGVCSHCVRRRGPSDDEPGQSR